MAWVMRVLVFVATAYLVVLVVLWAFQSRFIYPAPQTAAPLTPGYEEISLTTEDGLSLRSFYRGARNGLPTVVYFHGNGGTLAGASVSNRALAEAGFGVLLVEYRGYGGNPGAPSEQGFYRDGEAAIQWLAARGIASSDLVIVGNSIGAGVAAQMAVRHSPAAVILIAPFTSLPDAAKTNLWWLPVDWLMRDRFDNRNKIARLSAPLLVQHGSADTLIPPDHGKELAALGSGAAYQSFARAGHDLSFERRSQEARRDWLIAQFE